MCASDCGVHAYFSTKSAKQVNKRFPDTNSAKEYTGRPCQPLVYLTTSTTHTYICTLTHSHTHTHTHKPVRPQSASAKGQTRGLSKPGLYTH